MVDLKKLKVGTYISDGTGWYRVTEIKPKVVIAYYEWTNWAGSFSKRYCISKEDLKTDVWEDCDG